MERYLLDEIYFKALEEIIDERSLNDKELEEFVEERLTEERIQKYCLS